MEMACRGHRPWEQGNFEMACQGTGHGKDISNNNELLNLNCSSNQISSLIIGNNNIIEALVCARNLLTQLDVSYNSSLFHLNCSANQLISLDVSANTAFETLVCSANQLSSLDISANPELSILNCYENQLHNLDMRNGNNDLLTDLNATNNPSLTCISVDDVKYSTENWIAVDLWATFDLNCGFVVDFTADIVTGEAPLEIKFTDNTTGSPEIWSWDFDNDGKEDSNEQNPTFVFEIPGFYSVSLTAKNSITSKSTFKTEFIEVKEVITGLENLNKVGISCSPNPASDLIVIRSNVKIKSVLVVNQLGYIIYQKHNNVPIKGDVEIEITNYKPGNCIIQILSDDKFYTQKFIKIN
jgi:hypothetical protein